MDSFSQADTIYDLMYFETIPGIVNAIKREKQLKNWRKGWKWNLIKGINKELKDLEADWNTAEEFEK